MFFPPRTDIKPHTADFENHPLIVETGLREYDARWLFPNEINLMGIQSLGFALGHVLHALTDNPSIVVGHDFRSYSQSIKQALIIGLIAAGAKVNDIGLALSPTAYFAQFALDIPSVAMVTASHNENGWTGVKMGTNRPLTFGEKEMKLLRHTLMNNRAVAREGGTYVFIQDMAQRYIVDLTDRPPLTRKIKAVIACGNGTAGLFAPQVLETVGVNVIPLHCELNPAFPNHNPNPEDMKMLNSLRGKVLEKRADIGFAFDGDGDRCGIIDNEGVDIFADKIGVLIARNLAAHHKNARFITDVKSTSLFMTDPILAKYGAKTTYWKTGHSYIKRHLYETNALAAFEKSGHFFFNKPLGRGYDDGIITALSVCDILAQNPTQSMADLRRSLPKTWSSPTLSPYCADTDKYHVTERASNHFKEYLAQKKTILGKTIRDIITINGIRITLEDGTWGLIRASSNKPSLVVVVESPTSEKNMHDMFTVIDTLLSSYPEVGEYDQKF